MCLFLGEVLRIAIIDSPPFIILKNSTSIYQNMTDDYKQIDVTEFEGFYKDILLYLQDKMGFIPVIILAKPTTHYNELVRGVGGNRYDIVMTTLTITAERKKIVDFSLPIIPSSIRIVIQKPTSFQLDPLFFLKPFSTTLWLLLLAVVPHASVLLWLFERASNNEPHKDEDNNEKLSLRRATSYVIYTLINKSHDYVIRTSAAEGLRLGLSFLQIIFFAVYTASLLSNIVTQKPTLIITGLDDIINGKIAPDRIGIVAGSRIEEIYLNTVTHGKRNYYSLQKTSEVYTALINRDIDAALWTNLSITYHVNNVYCDLMAVGTEFSHSSYQLPIKQDWLYKAELDFNILSLLESPEFDQISNKWLESHSCSRTNTFDSSKKVITVETMSRVFIIYVCVSSIAILIHFLWRRMVDFLTNRIDHLFERNFNFLGIA